MQIRLTRRSVANVAAAVAAALSVAAAAVAQPAPQKPNAAPAASVKWADALKQKPDWYGTEEAVRVADNLLAYQTDAGGWDKNIDMAAPLTGRQLAELAKTKKDVHPTIDNGATFTQLVYLARVYTAKGLERHRAAFLKGFDYLIRAQYANGGWPQYYPAREGYYTHITYNDGAMIGVMKLLRDVAKKKSAYRFVDEGRRAQAERAVERGIECILKTQVVVKGRRTVWCAQHDEVTLLPAPARKFEPVSLSGLESVDIVQFLMSVERPDARVVESIESAVAWFKAAQLSGVRWVERPDASQPGGFNRAAVSDPSAPPIWARFYEIGTNRPVFLGRDGVVRYSVAEIDAERRNGYRWYTDEPAELINKDYPAWQKKLAQAK